MAHQRKVIFAPLSQWNQLPPSSRCLAFFLFKPVVLLLGPLQMAAKPCKMSGSVTSISLTGRHHVHNNVESGRQVFQKRGNEMRTAPTEPDPAGVMEVSRARQYLSSHSCLYFFLAVVGQPPKNVLFIAIDDLKNICGFTSKNRVIFFKSYIRIRFDAARSSPFSRQILTNLPVRGSDSHERNVPAQTPSFFGESALMTGFPARDTYLRNTGWASARVLIWHCATR